MRFLALPRNVFFLTLVTASSGKPTPELCFLPERLRWTLSKERYGDSLSGRWSNALDWEAG